MAMIKKINNTTIKKPGFNIKAIREDFPCLKQRINDRPLTFLDSAASAQKPKIVLDTLNRIYSAEYANVHRGVYYLSELATTQFEATRQKVADFINAARVEEIIFTKGATESINLVACSYGGNVLQEGDEILISIMEHHSNIVPWQQICAKTGAKLKVVPITNSDELDMAAFDSMLNKRTKIVAVLNMSNALGTILPIEDIITKAHNIGAVVLVDACQAIVHDIINVQRLDADFLVFSGHKLYGPNGTGILYGKYELLDSMPPYQTGGEMIEEVDFAGTSFQKPPLKFEAGTPIIAEIIAFGSAIDYINSQDRVAIYKHEKKLLAIATEELKKLPGFGIIGQAKNKASVLSFIHEQAHANDIGSILDQCGVAVRAGHHCTQPLMKYFNIPATARASFAMYNDEEDIEALLAGLHKVNKLFG